MRVAWAKTKHALSGNSYGYGRAAQGYLSALAHAGIGLDDEAPTVLHWTQPSAYQPVAGKQNILGTVCESLNVSPALHAACTHPDTTALFVPSTFCQQVFRRYTDKPVFVVGHPVDGEMFSVVPRAWNPTQEPFTFLYVGARNPRKGVDFLEEWWRETGMHEYPAARLYLKMTLGPKEQESLAAEGLPVAAVWCEGNMICDTRTITESELCQLYHQAHCFVLPSHGEGFGLTLAEAMATGLPCIATRFGGYLDFCDDDSAYLVDFRPAPFAGADASIYIGARPDPRDWCRQVHAVLQGYREASLRGSRAAERIRARCRVSQVSAQLSQMVGAVARGGGCHHLTQQSG